MADYPASVNARYEFRTHAPLPRLPSESTPSSPTFLLARRPSARWTAPPGRLHPHPWHPPSSSPTSTLRLPSCKTNSRPFFCSVARIYILYIYIMCTYIYIYIFRASTPRRRVFHAAKKAPGGSRGVLGWFCFLDNLWLDCVYVDGWSGGWLHTWVDGGLNNEEGRGVARWHGYAGGCSTLGTGVRW